ncbi:hypothetical protein PSN45_001449 [Yamadazyma tenuis]|uniref:uncharacterized protein n=1 Tax=Candida tenuis TaxID=2315449 RepID=UPI00279BACDE|nr:hypothetical protein PSN45_001449 [Yamadazyma tenuis]
MDYFTAKLHQQDIWLKDAIEVYLENSNSSMFSDNSKVSSTTLTYLVVKTHTVFSDSEYQHMLELKASSTHQVVFDSIIQYVQGVARELKMIFRFDSLLSFPLTDLKDISYQIALIFKQVFLVPIIHKHEISEYGVCSDTIRFISKYNEMWILTSLLVREYANLQ